MLFNDHRLARLIITAHQTFQAKSTKSQNSLRMPPPRSSAEVSFLIREIFLRNKIPNMPRNKTDRPTCQLLFSKFKEREALWQRSAANSCALILKNDAFAMFCPCFLTVWPCEADFGRPRRPEGQRWREPLCSGTNRHCFYWHNLGPGRVCTEKWCETITRFFKLSWLTSLLTAC